MASTKQCPYCGATVRSDEKVCPGCGSANEGYVEDTARTIYHPKTIEELKEYCAERGMPLLKMRFFIGENYQHPKAFGIYRDKDRFIVYKNKANGERAIRYQGPDEAHAVNELFAKLLDECHNRGIYPDGKPQQITNTGTSSSSQTRSLSGQSQRISRASNSSYSRSSSGGSSAGKAIGIFIILFFIIFMLVSVFSHSKDGYYRDNRNKLYYRYGSDWYVYSDTSYSYNSSWRSSYSNNNWSKTSSLQAESIDDYYLGTEYRSSWGGSDFKNSSAWDSIKDSDSSSSSDYDSWDSGDTDWDSDW